MNLNNQDAIYNIAINMIPKVGSIGVRNLITQCGSAREMFENIDEFVGMGIINPKIAETIRSINIVELAKKQIEICLKHNINTYFYLDNDYPRKLASCDNTPTLLYSLGKVNYEASHNIGIVGTRSSDNDGKNNIFQLVEDLKNDNINVIIISGLAAGADTYAHQAALKFGVPTVAVLGHGLNMVYPAENRHLAGEIVNSNGALLTEYFYGEPVNKNHFPCRNRIIAGLCDALIVAQSKSQGGALITAENARDFRREVFAFPGRASDKLYAGCNSLISENKATLISSAEDLKRIMGWKSKKKSQAEQMSLDLTPLNDMEVKILDVLHKNGTLTIDALSQISGIPMFKLSSSLLGMEFKGLVNGLSGKRYEAR